MKYYRKSSQWDVSNNKNYVYKEHAMVHAFKIAIKKKGSKLYLIVVRTIWTIDTMIGGTGKDTEISIVSGKTTNILLQLKYKQRYYMHTISLFLHFPLWGPNTKPTSLVWQALPILPLLTHWRNFHLFCSWCEQCVQDSLANSNGLAMNRFCVTM